MLKLGFTLVGLGVMIGWGAAFAGFLAPWWPAADMVNHFRPFMAGGAGLLLILSLALRSRKLTVGSSALLAASLALLLAASLLEAPRIATERPLLKVATLNTWIAKGQADRISEFVEETGADIILLQEIGAVDQEKLLPQLRSVYPYIRFGEKTRRSPAILSKLPWTETGVVPGSTDHPVAVWARFERNGRTFEIASVHTANPFLPEEQAEDVDRLIAFASSRPDLVVIGGDFNLTPYSWKLTKLALETGFGWSQTFSASWPANRLLPVVLLDHILVRGSLGVARVRTERSVGSDHLPVVSELGYRDETSPRGGSGSREESAP